MRAGRESGCQALRLFRTRPHSSLQWRLLRFFAALCVETALAERLVNALPGKHSCLPPEARGTSTFPERERPRAKQ